MKDFAKSIRTNNSVPGSWVKTRTVDGPAQEKEFRNYSLIVQEDSDEERGKKWWSWYVYRGNSEIASGESNSESEAKSKAENWLEHSVPMPTGNSKVGNATIDASTFGHADYPESNISQEIYKAYIESGKDKDRTLVKLLRNHPGANKQVYEQLIDKAVSSYEKIKKSGNESIYKQEASLFGGLGEKAEKEIGNGKPGSIASIGPAWMQGGTVYGKMDTDESGKRHNEYVKITWLGEGKGGVANYFIDDKMQSDKLGSLDKNELKRWAEAKIGNNKVGNYFNNGVHLTIRYNGKEEEVKVLKDMPTKVLVKGQSGNVVEINKTDLDVIKVHNETKGERKFGKVMGEFEEGSLKTPQGKTVTDPAQAKAIAYSEADKVDNLKRARNAMNKKVGNLDNVEEGDYVSVRYQGEIVDGVVRKIQGTQALVTIDGTDMWFPIRSLKEST